MQDTSDKVRNLLDAELERLAIFDPTLREGIISYFHRSGKMMRPGVMRLACGAAGGNPDKIWHLATALEVKHVCTLVHDDIMDQSDERRGGPSIHKIFEQTSLAQTLSAEKRKAFGRNMAILIGDTQGSWAAYLFLSAAEAGEVSYEIATKILSYFERITLPRIIEGQALDLCFENKTLNQLTEEEIMKMTELKTSELFSFAGLAGVMAALGNWQVEHPLAQTLMDFCSKVGLAFQLNDDMEDAFIEPKAMDLRTNKRTLLSWYVYSKATEEERKVLDSILGKMDALPSEIEQLRTIFKALGVDFIKSRMKEYIDEAKMKLATLPESPYKKLLGDWADFACSHSQES